MRHTSAVLLSLSLLLLAARPAWAFRVSGTGPAVTCQSNWSISNSNGRAQHPEISIIFWQDTGSGGYQWSLGNTGGGGPSQSIFIGETLSLVNSPYFGSLNWYGTSGGGFIARPRLSPYAAIFSGLPNGSPSGRTTSNFAMSDISNVVNTGISQGLLPPPDNADDSVYVVVLPGGSHGLQIGGPTGCVNNSGGCNVPGFSYNGVGYELVSVVANNGAEPTLAHELVEAISGYENISVSGCTYVKGGAVANQIADICAGYSGEPESYGAYGTGYSSQFQVAPYYSKFDGACVVPETWEGAWVNTGSGWYLPTSLNPRQISGGSHGFVATGENDDVFFYNQDQNTLTQIGGPGSMFAVGGGIVAGVTPDTSYGVNVYNLYSGQWSALGAPNGPVTGVAVTSGGGVLATDQYGNPWFNGNLTGWTQIGGPGDQFIAFDTDIIALTPNKSVLEVWNNGWSPIYPSGGPFANIVAGPDNGSWLLEWQGNSTVSDDVQVFSNAGGWDYSLNNVGGYDLIMKSQAGTNADYTTFNGGWSGNGGVSGKLVSGNALFATGCASGNQPNCVYF